MDGDDIILNVTTRRAVTPIPMGFACYEVVSIDERGLAGDVAQLRHRGIVEDQGEADTWLRGEQPRDLVDVWSAPDAPRYVEG